MKSNRGANTAIRNIKEACARERPMQTKGAKQQLAAVNKCFRGRKLGLRV